VFLGRLLVLNRRVAVSHVLPEISILSKLTQIPDVSSGRSACKRKKSQRREILTSGLYETAVKDSVQQKFITGTKGGGGRGDAKEQTLLANLQESREN